MPEPPCRGHERDPGPGQMATRASQCVWKERQKSPAQPMNQLECRSSDLPDLWQSTPVGEGVCVGGTGVVVPTDWKDLRANWKTKETTTMTRVVPSGGPVVGGGGRCHSVVVGGEDVDDAANYQSLVGGEGKRKMKNRRSRESVLPRPP